MKLNGKSPKALIGAMKPICDSGYPWQEDAQWDLYGYEAEMLKYWQTCNLTPPMALMSGSVFHWYDYLAPILIPFLELEDAM